MLYWPVCGSLVVAAGVPLTVILAPTGPLVTACLTCPQSTPAGEGKSCVSSVVVSAACTSRSLAV